MSQQNYLKDKSKNWGYVSQQTSVLRAEVHSWLDVSFFKATDASINRFRLCQAMKRKRPVF
jgi:hypothetical protein